MKVILIAFFYGMIFIVHTSHMVKQLQRRLHLRQAVRKRRPEVWASTLSYYSTVYLRVFGIA